MMTRIFTSLIKKKTVAFKFSVPDQASETDYRSATNKVVVRGVPPEDLVGNSENFVTICIEGVNQGAFVKKGAMLNSEEALEIGAMIMGYALNPDDPEVLWRSYCGESEPEIEEESPAITTTPYVPKRNRPRGRPAKTFKEANRNISFGNLPRNTETAKEIVEMILEEQIETEESEQ